MKAVEQYFPVVLFIMLYKKVPTFKSVDESLKCVDESLTLGRTSKLIPLPWYKGGWWSPPRVSLCYNISKSFHL